MSKTVGARKGLMIRNVVEVVFGLLSSDFCLLMPNADGVPENRKRKASVSLAWTTVDVILILRSLHLVEWGSLRSFVIEGGRPWV